MAAPTRKAPATPKPPEAKPEPAPAKEAEAKPPKFTGPEKQARLLGTVQSGVL